MFLLDLYRRKVPKLKQHVAYSYIFTTLHNFAETVFVKPWAISVRILERSRRL